MRNFPLGQESAFDFTLPEQGLTVEEWRKVACHLLTLATDFNPMKQQHAQAFAVVAQKEV
jgi:hypothetical protein